MSHPPSSKRAWQRITYTAMSLLVAWHTAAMVLASAPESDMTITARSLFQPYLTLFRLDNDWGFFAPDVPRGRQFHYVVEDADGKRHTYVPAEKLNRLTPEWIWFNDRYRTIAEYPEEHADRAALSLCRAHAGLRPVSVTLLEVEQTTFPYTEWLSGKRPLDPEFVNVNVVKAVPCPTP